MHASATPYVYERIDKNDAALLIVDHQEGLYLMCRDRSAVDVKSGIIAHATLAKIFNLPTVLTTSTETGMDQTVTRSTLVSLTCLCSRT